MLLQVKYGKALTGGASHPATFVRVYDIFGPTYPGEYDEQNRMYSLHYPGVVFLFPIPEQHAQRCRENQIELPLEFLDGSTPLAARICVHAAAEGNDLTCLLTHPQAICRFYALSIGILGHHGEGMGIVDIVMPLPYIPPSYMISQYVWKQKALS